MSFPKVVFKAVFTPDTGVTHIKWSLPCLICMLIFAFRVTPLAVRNSFTTLISQLITFYSLSQHSSWRFPLSLLLLRKQASRSVWFHCIALSQCISSDVIMINVNHAGFTVCLFYGAFGSVELGPSTRAPACSGRWTGGFAWRFDLILGCVTLACLRTLAAEQWLRCQSCVTANISCQKFSLLRLHRMKRDYISHNSPLTHSFMCFIIMISSTVNLTCAGHCALQFGL